MKNPNEPDEFAGQIRKAFIGTEPTPAPAKGVDRKVNAPLPPVPKPRIQHG
jgi:hypothetical protein